MYGVNAYLGAVCDFYAGHGYLAIAPALYDRRQREMTFAYDKAGHDQARSAPTKPGAGALRWPISMPAARWWRRRAKSGSLVSAGADRSPGSVHVAALMTPPSSITAPRCRTFPAKRPAAPGSRLSAAPVRPFRPPRVNQFPRRHPS